MNDNNNQVTEDTTIIPQTPSDYVLPKDQQMMTQKLETVNVAPVQESAPVVEPQVIPQPQVVPQPPVAPVEQNIPAPPVPPVEQNIPTPPSAPASDDNTIATINTTNVAPSIDLSNVDLNANANAQSLDLTQVSGAKEGITITGNEKPKKKKVKLIPIIAIVLIVGSLIGGGVYFYMSQFKSADKRIDAVVDKVLSPITSTTNYKINDGSGTYTFAYNSSTNEEQLIIEANGKYAYSLPNRQIDLITNFTKYNNNQELLSEELNSELYLKDDKAYLLLSNFNDNYIYTDINNSYNTIKDVESRFNDPEDLLLFKLTNYLFENGLDDFSHKYNTYINSIYNNDKINYVGLLNGVKGATKSALKAAPVTQSLEGTTNVVTIDVKSAATQKKMYKAFVNSLHNNKSAFEQLTILTGLDDETLYNDLLESVENKEYKDLSNNIVIKSNMFKSNLIELSVPYNYGDETRVIVATPSGNGYKIIVKNSSKEILNVKYTKKTSKTSTTETKDYAVEGMIYNDSTVTNLNITLEVVKDVTPSKDYPITKDSVDYKVLTTENFSATAAEIEKFGNLGVLFKSHYKGVETPTEGETPNEMP